MTDTADDTVAVLFSGGTDSTCAAALMAERFSRLRLLTFDRYGFHQIEKSKNAASLLIERFSNVEITHSIIKIDRLFSHLAFKDYFERIRRFGFMMAQNCTFCALANHFRALSYCLEHGIRDVADGVTRELRFLPSHMEAPIQRLRTLYESYGMRYHTPVYDFEIPREMNFFDKVLLPDSGDKGVAVEPERHTTGRMLHELGVMPTENIKGSALDRKLQYRCFQYVLHNMVAFGALNAGSDYARYEKNILEMYDDAIMRFAPEADGSGPLSGVLEGERP